jgi:WD40 repeat protein
VYFCEFSPDGKMLFTGSDDGTAKIWKIDEKVPTLGDEKLIETLEQKFNPTKEDKNTFIRG